MGGDDHHGHDSHQKVSIPPEEIKKLIAKAQTQVFSEAPKYRSDDNSGVVPMNLRGRFEDERARLGPDFTESDRQYRIKWLSSQNLHPEEPFFVQQIRTTNNPNLNIFRRIYQAPLNILERALAKRMHPEYATITRKLIGRSVIGYVTVLFIWYQINYNAATWEAQKGIRTHVSREAVLPGDPRWPMKNPRTESWQHYDRFFHERKVFLHDDKKSE